MRWLKPGDEGLLLAIEGIPKRPILNAMFAADEETRSRRSVWNSPMIVDLGMGFMHGFISAAHQQQKLQENVSPEIMTEWVYRILLSFLTLPSNWIKSKRALRATLRALLLPVLLKDSNP